MINCQLGELVHKSLLDGFISESFMVKEELIRQGGITSAEKRLQAKLGKVKAGTNGQSRTEEDVFADVGRATDARTNMGEASYEPASV